MRGLLSTICKTRRPLMRHQRRKRNDLGYSCIPAVDNANIRCRGSPRRCGCRPLATPISVQASPFCREERAGVLCFALRGHVFNSSRRSRWRKSERRMNNRPTRIRPHRAPPPFLPPLIPPPRTRRGEGYRSFRAHRAASNTCVRQIDEAQEEASSQGSLVFLLLLIFVACAHEEVWQKEQGVQEARDGHDRCKCPRPVSLVVRRRGRDRGHVWPLAWRGKGPCRRSLQPSLRVPLVRKGCACSLSDRRDRFSCHRSPTVT